MLSPISAMLIACIAFELYNVARDIYIPMSATVTKYEKLGLRKNLHLEPLLLTIINYMVDGAGSDYDWEVISKKHVPTWAGSNEVLLFRKYDTLHFNNYTVVKLHIDHRTSVYKSIFLIYNDDGWYVAFLNFLVQVGYNMVNLVLTPVIVVSGLFYPLIVMSSVLTQVGCGVVKNAILVPGLFLNLATQEILYFKSSL